MILQLIGATGNGAPGKRDEAVGLADGLNHGRRRNYRSIDDEGEAVGSSQLRVDQVVGIAVGDYRRDGISARTLVLAGRPCDDARGINGRPGGRLTKA